MSSPPTPLTDLARLGFMDLARARDDLQRLDAPSLTPLFARAADPDQALRAVLSLLDSAPKEAAELLDDEHAAIRLFRVLGASSGLRDFFERHPSELRVLASSLTTVPDAAEYESDMRSAVRGLVGDQARVALRVRYRRHLAQLAAWDLEQDDPLVATDRAGMGLADLAGATLDAALDSARTESSFPPADVARTRLAIVGMGKAGARELNYLSDVDVIFVVEGSEGLDDERAVQIGTALAIGTMRAIYELEAEPGLWEVDANLRPEGKNGALVRTLASHVAYYERWAKSWEFQALVKARPLAGHRELGERYIDGLSPMVWSSASRENFVESVQRMRERVKDNIPAGEVDVQLKLGPGGLRDIEFTVQLLQLVHGQSDPEIRQRGTLPALVALADRGYIGREEAAQFSSDYRFLRLLEHRLQLARLRRTHLMPTDPDALRTLARASGIATSSETLLAQWHEHRLAVRRLHERLFYRPLLSAVAALPEDSLVLTSGQAEARLAAIGFANPSGALKHIAALSGGVSRRASIQRALLPIMLEWLAEGPDPDYGLLSFRKLSEDLGETYWFLRMLRDSSGVAERLTRVLSGSRFIAKLFERIPEAAAWLEHDEELRPRSLAALLEESRSIIARHDSEENAAHALRGARRREVLRTALGGMLGVTSIEQIGHALSDITTALLGGVVSMVHRFGDGIEFGIIAMGRYGGSELGFGSDADIMYVYRAAGISDEDAGKQAERLVRAIAQHTEDLYLPLELDIGLRPEGKNGAVVRSLESYRAYYARWSLTWEAQALLRARGVAGDLDLLDAFESLANEVRYPSNISTQDVREVKRIKARVESERLPQAADPRRHLKLGRGSLSDVEWFVQLLQLQHGDRLPGLRTTSTLHALSAAVEEHLVTSYDADVLRAAWVLASRARSGMTLWTSKTVDVLPTDHRKLEGVAQVLEYPPGSAAKFEDDYLRTTRLARAVFERRFYGEPSTS